MSYRDDELATHHRRDALEREVVALEQRQRDAVTPRRQVDWSAVVPVSIGGVITTSFTAAAIVLGWSLAWAIAGFVLTCFVLLALVGVTGSALPTGAIPIRLDLDVPCIDGRTAVRLLATVQLATDGDRAETARKLFLERPRSDVSDTAAGLLEAAAREIIAPLRRDEVAATKGFLELLDPAARGALHRAGLELTSLWAGPA